MHDTGLSVLCVFVCAFLGARVPECVCGWVCVREGAVIDFGVCLPSLLVFLVCQNGEQERGDCVCVSMCACGCVCA